MSHAVAVERRAAALEGVALARWPRSAAASAVRWIVQTLVLFPLVRLTCRPLRIERVATLRREDGPFVLVANHASHADTAVIMRALPRWLRPRTAPAAAEDYFFRGRLRGTLAALGIGAFPFPRRGTAGIARVEALLDAGWSVLLFPEGTRSLDGTLAGFRSGVGILASRGAPVVPIGIAGAAEVLPKGRRRPRRAPVSVVIGEPVRFRDPAPPVILAECLRARVSRLRVAARLLRPAPQRTVFQRARDLATSRAGLVLAFCWGVAEGLFLPIVPDVPVALLAVAAPGRFLPLALAATAGSLTGGTLAYALGSTVAGGWLVAHAPLVTDRMRVHAFEAMGTAGAHPLLAQPWTGIPFKVFGYQASAAGVGFASYLGFALAGRGLRILAAGAVFAGASWPAHRFATGWVERLYPAFCLSFAVVFALGLTRVVASWS